MGQLRFLDDGGQFNTLDLLEENLTIGRDESCGLQIQGDLISREHAQLIREPDGKWRLKDLGSRNRTIVNGQVVSEVLLTPGDIIHIGEKILEYKDGDTRPTLVVRECLITDRKDPPGCEWIKVKEPVPLGAAQFEAVGALSEQCGIAPRVEDLADHALMQLLIDLDAKRGLIALKGNEAKELELISVRGFGRRAAQGSFVGISQSFVFSGLLQHVAGRYPAEGAEAEEGEHNYPATAMVAPLVSRGKGIGVIYLDRPLGSKAFGKTALHQMMAAGAVVGSAMVRAQRRLAAMQVQYTPAYLAVNRRIQSELLVLPTCGENFSAATRLVMGRESCGDLLETVVLNDNRVVMVMTDAGGMGISGFVHSMSIFSALRVALEAQEEAADLGAAFEAVNRTLSSRSARQLVGCAAVLVDLTAGRLSYINAGLKPPLLVVGPQRLVTLEKTSPMLGADIESTYDPAFADLSSKFRVILHTDGLTDALNPAGESFGEEQVHECLLQAEAFDAPERMIDLILAALDEHAGSSAPSDDVLILVLAHG